MTGIGTSTLCRRLSRIWDLPYTELDSLHHGPEWTPRPTFPDDVARIAAQPRWVSELQYLGSGGGWALAERMQTLLWLDFPRRVSRPRLLRRTVRRAISRQELWPGTGNVEPPFWHVLTDPDHLLRWEARTHRKWRDDFVPLLRERFPAVHVVHFAHPRELDAWLIRLRA